MTREAYEAVPYRGVSITYTAPEHLALCARYHGGPDAPATRCRVLEIGCGMGANLIALAFHRPDSTFVGVDRSASYVHHATQVAATLGIDNVRFEVGEIASLAPPVEPFDYVLAHGVLSWVPDEDKRGLLRACRQNLSRRGVAYVSYNCQPGWSVRGLMRDFLPRLSRVRQAGPTARAGVAIAEAKRLSEILGEPDHPFLSVIANELAHVARADAWYLEHDHLSAVNDPLWFGELDALATEEGLGYVGDAMLGHPEGAVHPSLRERLDGRSSVEREETIDLLCGRFMRASLLARQDAPRRPIDLDALLDDAWVASALSARSDPFELADGVREAFAGYHDVDVHVDNALSKAALLVLAAQWPRGARLDDLVRAATAVLREHGLERLPEDAEARFRRGVLDVYAAGQIDLRLREPPPCPPAGDRPRASALARWEAEHGVGTLTSPHHTPLPLDAPTRAAIAAMDGERTRDRLGPRELVDAAVSAAERWGLLVP